MSSESSSTTSCCNGCICHALYVFVQQVKNKISALACDILSLYYLYFTNNETRYWEAREITSALRLLNDEDWKSQYRFFGKFHALGKVDTKEALHIENVPEAFEEAKTKLQTALKTHRVSFFKFWDGLENEKGQEIGQLRAEFLRLGDLNRNKEGYAYPRPEPKCLLSLNFKLRFPHDVKRESISKIPSYLFEYPDGIPSAVNQEKVSFNDDSKGLWKKTLEYVEEKILPNPLTNMSAVELKNLLAALHKSLTGSDEDTLRTEDLIIYSPNGKYEFKERIENLRNQEKNWAADSMEEIKWMCERWGSLQTASHYFEERHWEVLQDDHIFVPEPEKIGQFLENFCKGLVAILQKEELDPRQIATFIHHGILAIRPYGQFNSRLARLMMNIYLMQSGLKPYIVTNNIIYKTSVFSTFQDGAQTFCMHLFNAFATIDEKIGKNELKLETDSADTRVNQIEDN